MDIRVISQITGGATSASAVSVPADSRALLSEIAANTALSDSQRTNMVAAVAAADSGLQVDRGAALERIQMLGLYLRNTGDSSFPRWTMMTALRAYGMNLTEEAAAPSAVNQALQAAVAPRNVSVETAVVVARTMPPLQAPVAKPIVKADAPAPAPDAGVGRVERIA
ncbi:MAG: hypothetical protein DI628_01230 [Blastochloris viridis]|uniref:Uncharacterized protein n=1 Tax=Blastochloris viridis TaxID=1079 RepID=A0A6N4R7J4_BLAVI|nr:MAG: hypothetical protein DI628_01230 [Blastochloris viridis]